MAELSCGASLSERRIDSRPLGEILLEALVGACGPALERSTVRGRCTLVVHPLPRMTAGVPVIVQDFFGVWCTHEPRVGSGQACHGYARSCRSFARSRGAMT